MKKKKKKFLIFFFFFWCLVLFESTMKSKMINCNKYCKNGVQQPKPTQSSGALDFNPNLNNRIVLCRGGKTITVQSQAKLKASDTVVKYRGTNQVVNGKKSFPLPLSRKSSYISLFQVFIKLYTVLSFSQPLLWQTNSSGQTCFSTMSWCKISRSLFFSVLGFSTNIIREMENMI